MIVSITRPFPFSRDGFTSEWAQAGGDADIPDDLVPGLMKAGYVEAKAIPAAPENKAVRRGRKAG